MARSFSAELMDIFRIENSISDLDNQVVQRSVGSLSLSLSLTYKENPTPLMHHTNRETGADLSFLS